MRYRPEKTTKQIENEELSRLTEATGQGGEGRPTTQLDPDALRALLGTDEVAPVAPPRAEAAPPVVETPVATSPRHGSRLLVAAICVALGVIASVVVLTLR
ncbi:MAG: hypothetical protein SFX73_13095 [Kofleriaceae bacterium]|nr:hypothetical protein [Kofleriaceae bacterium]